MSLKKLAASIAALAVITMASAQSGAYEAVLPEILPASPEPASFVKAGVGNSNMSTGAASVNIPLYTIKLRDFSFPLSLSYSTQGLKADEASSRVGLGWVLNATGMITRSVRDKPDEFAKRMPVPANFELDTGAVYSFLANATDPYSDGDSQPDEFQFSCNGYSGKFILDNNYIPRTTATSNVKVDVQIQVTPNSTAGGISSISITTPDGIKYKFGSAYERTITHNIGIQNPFRDVTKTAFFLDKIELPTGENIQFHYSAINIRVATGISQTLQLARVDGANDCGSCESRNSYTTKEGRVEYRTNYLSSITSSNGLEVEFTYESRNDQSYDVRLAGMRIGDFKQYAFNYYDVPIPPAATVITGRFFLTKLREIRLSEATHPDSSYDYVFTYNRLDQVPLPITFKQDYLGFYTSNSANCLVPPTVNSDGTIDFSFRNPDWELAKKGTLMAIQYPTGGKEEFLYEPNTMGRYESRKKDTYQNIVLDGSGGTSTAAVYVYDYISVSKHHAATLTLSVDDAVLNDGYTANPNHNTATLTLYEGTTVVASRSALGYGTLTTTVNLLAGHTYKLVLTVKSYTERGVGTLSYDPTSQDIYEDVYVETIIPGGRVKQIKYTDPLTKISHSKYYKYAGLSDLQLSTGGMYGTPVFKSRSVYVTYCGQFGDMETRCLVDIYSSNSSNDVYNYAGSGSLIYYKTVIESDDPDFKNGGTEYTFYNNEQGGNHQVVLGQEIPYLPQGQFPTLSGAIFTKKVFNSNKELVQAEQTDYETLIYLDNMVYSVNVRKNFAPYITRPDRLGAFDAVRSHYGSYWIRQKTTTSITYSGTAALESKTNYFYGTTVNILPAAITTKDSKNQELKSEMKYPTDFSGDAIYAKLTAKNIIAPVVHQSSYRNGILQQQKKVIYDDWFNDSKILLPKTIQIKESPADALQNALQFSKYDVKGNPLQINKVNDVPIVYLWDTGKGLPLCEVKGADYNQVAFSGFEAGPDYGNWQLVSGAVSQASAFTGIYSFTGTLSKTINMPGIYVVRLWTNSGATVNGASGTLLTTKRGWSLYEWKLVNPSTVSVQGTSLDDVRLHPNYAMMVTYTYKPFIGITSRSDEKLNVIYNVYDYMGRLVTVRDIDYNVIKNYEYQYIPNTEHKWAVWQPTGETSCQSCSLNPSYNSGILLKREKNIGTQGNGELRWVEAGYDGSCKENAVWQNTATAPRCIKDASGYNTGVQEQEQIDVNPCSKSYNTKRWITAGTNYNSCPLICPDCTAMNKKCIGGVCQTGYLSLVSSTNTGTNSWICVYRYQFPDGTFSEEFTVNSTSGCGVD